MENAPRREYNTDELKEAMRIVRKAKRAGNDGDWPGWVEDARRQYHRDWARAKRAETARQMEEAGIVKEVRVKNLPLREDKIIDWTAIRIMVNGDRVVSLTRNERLIAAAYLRDRFGMSQADIERRFDMTNIGRYFDDIDKGKVKDVLAALERGDMEQSGDPLKF